MKKISNKVIFSIIIISIISSIIFSIFAYKNFNRYQQTSKLYKEQNKVLKKELKTTENDINSLKSKLDIVEKKLKKIDEKSKKFESLNINSKEKYNNLLLSSINGNFDRDRKTSIKKRDFRFRKLRSAYYSDYEVSTLDESKSNIAVNSLLINDYIYSSFNRKVIKNNSDIFKITGVYDYYNNTNNYILKEKLAYLINENKFDGNYKNLENKTFNLLYLKENIYNLYDLLLFPSENNYEYLLAFKDKLESEKTSSKFKMDFKQDDTNKNDIKNLNNTMLFGIDTYSQNIDYLRSYDIVDKTYELDSNVQVLRYLVDNRDRLYMTEERIDGKPVTLNYYNSSGNPFLQVDMNNYKIYYFENNNSSDKFNHSMSLYKKYKRD